MRHLEDGLMMELVDGEVPSTALGEIQAHLATCAECRARLDAVRTLTDEVDGLVESLDENLPAREAPGAMPFRTPVRWTRQLAWAASLVLAVGLGYAGRGAMESTNPITSQALVEADPQVAREAPPRTSAPPRGATAATGGRESDGGRGQADRRDPPTEAGTREARATAPDQERSAVEDPLPPAAAASGVAVAAGERAELRGAVAPKPVRTGEQSAARTAARIADDLVPRDQATAPLARQRVAAVVDTVDLPEAMRRLGGSIRLIDGMVPVRLEARGDEVDVAYESSWGEVLLRQARLDETITWRIVAPGTVPADSVTAWRSRVRP